MESIEDRLKINEELVEKIIKRSENPHPFVLIIVATCSIIIIYIIDILIDIDNISGIWIDINDYLYNIDYNKWTNSLLIDNLYKGFIKGSIIKYSHAGVKKMGIIENKRIYWTNQSTWYKIN